MKSNCLTCGTIIHYNYDMPYDKRHFCMRCYFKNKKNICDECGWYEGKDNKDYCDCPSDNSVKTIDDSLPIH